jgi:hypothetical protein
MYVRLILQRIFEEEDTNWTEMIRVFEPSGSNSAFICYIRLVVAKCELDEVVYLIA